MPFCRLEFYHLGKNTGQVFSYSTPLMAALLPFPPAHLEHAVTTSQMRQMRDTTVQHLLRVPNLDRLDLSLSAYLGFRASFAVEAKTTELYIYPYIQHIVCIHTTVRIEREAQHQEPAASDLGVCVCV